MAFVPLADRTAGYQLDVSDWDAFKDNMNGATIVKLDDVTLTGTAPEIEFASIDLSFSHLMIQAYLRGDDSASSVAVNMRLNSDVSANYDRQHLSANAATPAASESFGAAIMWIANVPAATAPANLFGPVTVDIPGYSQTSGHKAVLSQWGAKYGTTTGTLQTGLGGGHWRSTAVVSNVKLIPGSGSWVIGSRATLYALA